MEAVDAGGAVLWGIALISFLMWVLILERLLYFRLTHPGNMREHIVDFKSVPFAREWERTALRRAFLSQNETDLRGSFGIIKMLVAVSPLFGLLGTVSGMIEVFDVMATLGSSNPKAMAGGVSMAIIPTMAAMVVSITGLFFVGWYGQRIKQRQLQFEEALL